MCRLLLFVFVLLAVSATASPVKNQYYEHNYDQSDNSWDFLLYVTRWLPSITSEALPDNVTTFTMHGIWPTRNDTSYPSYCNNIPYSADAIESLVPQLETVWYDYEHEQNSFWSHEWTKHGTCSINDNLLSDQYNFFRAAIVLHSATDVRSALASAGIVPNGNAYSISSITNAISSAIAPPLLYCSTDSNGNTLLDVIYFCFDASLHIYQCNEAMVQQAQNEGNCGSGPLVFPPIVNQRDVSAAPLAGEMFAKF